MSAFNINEYYGCSTCEAADKYGNGCKYGMLFPVLLAMGNHRQCPNYRYKNKELNF